MFRDFTMNSLSISRFYYKFTIESRIHYEFSFCSANSLYITLIYHEITFVFAKSLSISRNNDEFTIFFANSLWIHYRFANSLWIQFRFRKFTIYNANLPWNQFRFCDSTVNWLSVPEIHYLLRLYKMKSPSISRIHY